MGAAKKSDNSIARAGFAEDVGAQRSYKAFTILPSRIKANHENNYARAAVYSLAVELPELAGHPALESERVCFTRAEVMERAESFKQNNQRQAIKVWRTGTHVPYVAEGYLRHLAALFMEVTGALADVSEMRAGLRCEAEEQPKTPEAQVAAAWSNHAENADRKATTPIDDAWLCKRLFAMHVPMEEIQARLGGSRGKDRVSKRTIERLLQLLSLPIALQLDVHEGRKTVMQALGKASDEGLGSSRGADPGVKRARMRRRKPDDRPKKGLSHAEQLDVLVDVLIGDKTVAEINDEQVKEWITYLNAPPEPREPQTQRKKKPAKPGEKLPTDEQGASAEA